MLGSHATVPESIPAALDVDMEAAWDEVDNDWAHIQEWVTSNGDPAIHALQLDRDTDYQQWLANALGNPAPPVWADADTATLVHLRAGYGRTAGYREVKPAGLLQKMEDITLAKIWREWDVAKVCVVAQLDTTDKTGLMYFDKPRYLDFHHRACALHVLAYSFKARGLDMPGWLLGLARAVKIQWKGSMAKIEWLAMGWSWAASMQCGQVKLSWIDIIQQVNMDASLAGDSSSGLTLQQRIYEISPEHAAKLHDWKNMRTFIQRVDPEVYTIMEDVMVEYGRSTPIIPLTWLRDPAFLLNTAKSQKDGLTPKEQQVAVQRLLCLICQRLSEWRRRLA